MRTAQQGGHTVRPWTGTRLLICQRLQRPGSSRRSAERGEQWTRAGCGRRRRPGGRRGGAQANPRRCGLGRWPASRAPRPAGSVCPGVLASMTRRSPTAPGLTPASSCTTPWPRRPPGAAGRPLPWSVHPGSMTPAVPSCSSPALRTPGTLSPSPALKLRAWAAPSSSLTSARITRTCVPCLITPGFTGTATSLPGQSEATLKRTRTSHPRGRQASATSTIMGRSPISCNSPMSSGDRDT